MRSVLATRGGFQLLEFASKQNPNRIHIYLLKSELKRSSNHLITNHIITNIFQEHTYRRYIQSCTKKVLPPLSLTSIYSCSATRTAIVKFMG